MAGKGISFPKEQLRRIDEPLEFGDNRSDRVVELVNYGLAVEHVFQERDIDWSDKSLTQVELDLIDLMEQALDIQEAVR